MLAATAASPCLTFVCISDLPSFGRRPFKGSSSWLANSRVMAIRVKHAYNSCFTPRSLCP